jgi:hypothetical protein
VRGAPKQKVTEEGDAISFNSSRLGEFTSGDGKLARLEAGMVTKKAGGMKCDQMEIAPDSLVAACGDPPPVRKIIGLKTVLGLCRLYHLKSRRRCKLYYRQIGHFPCRFKSFINRSTESHSTFNLSRSFLIAFRQTYQHLRTLGRQPSINTCCVPKVTMLSM